MIQSLTRTVAVSVCSVILTTLAVNATDSINVPAGSMLAGVFGASTSVDTGPCPKDMRLVKQALVPFCVDAYEAAAGDSCPYETPRSVDETNKNLSGASCAPVSKAGTTPWRFVDVVQAQAACSRAGKRLLTADEWYKASLGTPDTSSEFTGEQCNVARNLADGVAPTGSAARCVSDAGAYDMVGNVWEWVDGAVRDGVFEGRSLPRSGYVQGADTSGIAYETASGAQAAFGRDRFWSDSIGTMGLMRGGYFDSEGDAGVFSIYAASPPTFAGEAVGFRCATAPKNP